MFSRIQTSRPRTFVLLAAAALLAPAVASAQSQIGSYTYQLGPDRREDPAVALSRYVRDLSSNPQSLVALKGAGAAALRLGDVEAAGGFFARAEEVSPRDGEVKAGIASALAMMGQPDQAMGLFAEAASLGVPDRNVAAYRGLAYDLKGDQAAAQKDYALAIRTMDDAPEVERRLALSQAISGDRLLALRTIEEQLRHQDKAAWRTRAFILALTGDIAGANEAVRVAIPAQAAAFAPFLAQLPSLNPAEKAAAVNLGQMPVTFQNLRTSQAAQPAPIQPQPVPIPQQQRATAPIVKVPPAPKKREPQPAPSTPRLQFADIASLVQDLPEPVAEAKPKAVTPPPARLDPKPVAAKRPEPKKAEAKKLDPAKAHPARNWVQLASGSNAAALPGEYGRIKGKAKLLASKTAWTVKAGATNRLLVGPFKSAKEAQAFVNDLAKDKVNGFAWTSMAGQEIEKLAAK